MFNHLGQHQHVESGYLRFVNDSFHSNKSNSKRIYFRSLYQKTNRPDEQPIKCANEPEDLIVVTVSVMRRISNGGNNRSVPSRDRLAMGGQGTGNFPPFN